MFLQQRLWRQRVFDHQFCCFRQLPCVRVFFKCRCTHIHSNNRQRRAAFPLCHLMHSNCIRGASAAAFPLILFNILCHFVLISHYYFLLHAFLSRRYMQEISAKRAKNRECSGSAGSLATCVCVAAAARPASTVFRAIWMAFTCSAHTHTHICCVTYIVSLVRAFCLCSVFL